jgi:hypothetical protein
LRRIVPASSVRRRQFRTDESITTGIDMNAASRVVSPVQRPKLIGKEQIPVRNIQSGVEQAWGMIPYDAHYHLRHS